MGEMSFDAATRAASLITSSGKVLCDVTLGAFAQQETKQVTLADNIANYDVIFAITQFGTWISGNIQYGSVQCGEELFSPMAGGTAFGVYAKLLNGNYIGMKIDRNPASGTLFQLSGTSARVYSVPRINAGTRVVIYGLKLG